MFKNYIKISFRNLWKHKGFSFINISGLAIGLAAGFLMLLYVGFELSYDHFHSKSDTIYRVVANIEMPTGTMETDKPAIAVPPHLKKEFPEILDAVRVMDINLDVRNATIKLKENNAIAADSTFFKMFDFEILQGDKNNVLKAPYSIVLSETAAKKYFGNQPAIGQTLKIKNEDIHDINFTVTGLMKDFPENSHMQADMVISMTTYTQGVLTDFDQYWGTYDPSAYLLLNPNVDPVVLASKFPDFLERNIGEDMKKSKSYVSLFLEPLNEVYLYSSRGGGISGDIDSIYVFSIIAIFILLIASINFINLTTARSVERAKEVGVRKVIGAEKRQLTFQFIGESIIIALLAFILSIVLIAIFLPLFNTLSGKIVSPGIFSNVTHIGILFIIALTIGALAGTYPAFVLSSFKPVQVLKGSFSTGTKGILLRKGLVVVQFTISIALIIGTIIIYNQMNYMRNQELGFDKEQIVVLETNISPAQKKLQDNLNNLPGVISTSFGSSVPGGGNNIAYSLIKNKNGEEQVINIDAYFTDYNFISQFGLKVVAGRTFSRDFGTDSTEAMVLNEAAVKLLGYNSPEEALGINFSQWGKSGQVIGVVKDFHFTSLEENINPLTMTIAPNRTDLLSVKISTRNIEETLSSIEQKWETILPDDSFEFYFLDEAFNEQYRTHERFGNLFISFTILAILISCLGLLGLVAYSTLQRKREIGVRKVLGASVIKIIKLLSKEFISLVGIAFIIASPVAWFIMSYWLEDFAYRIGIQWWMFVLAGMSALFIAFIAVCFHATKASFANPVKSLRTE
ncbi:putative ABC transport system permease protein [Aquimarina sp. MAR_2010_214]|uniref:ABC transporter permease n=1 Tax=Aquimarina sp. MAR_2010_214 TaxID=1250026 RepID=UPI000C704AA6|nr:ABC transporter permease [Aquimarina sp. MAR_2010_214]PKV49015.1 putative ABC transport system permease protein [Aquimarina sp. MAR_2010_214]